MLEKTAAYLQIAPSYYEDLRVEAKKEVDFFRGLPEIVCLAGSSRYREAFERESERLTLEGCIVLGKHVYKPGEEWDLSEAHKDMIHAVQFRKVDISHRVHIVNVDGYVGTDTYNIVRYALRAGVPMTFYSPFVETLNAQGPAHMTIRQFLNNASDRNSIEGD